MPLSSKKGPGKRNQLTTFIHFCDGGGEGRGDIATCAIQLAREAKMDARSRINKAPGRRTFFIYIYVHIYIYLYIYFRLHFIFFLVPVFCEAEQGNGIQEKVQISKSGSRELLKITESSNHVNLRLSLNLNSLLSDVLPQIFFFLFEKSAVNFIHRV